MPCAMMLCLCLSNYCLAGPQATRADSESCLEEAELVPRRGKSWPRRGTASRRQNRKGASKRRERGLEEAKWCPKGERWPRRGTASKRQSWCLEEAEWLEEPWAEARGAFVTARGACIFLGLGRACPSYLGSSRFSLTHFLG